MSKAKSVNDVIADLESQELHPTREMARKTVEEYKASTKLVRYDFDHAPQELKRIMYNGTVKWSRRTLFARLFRR